MVGGTGIEPVTPTMSRFAAMSKILINMKLTASNFALCSRFAHVKLGQSWAKTGRRTAVLALAFFTLSIPALGGQNVWIIEQPGKDSEKVDLSPVDDLPDFIPKPKPKPSMPAVKFSAPSDVTDVNPAETPDQTVPKQ